jgi:AcrR family transcriptional regulator
MVMDVMTQITELSTRDRLIEAAISIIEADGEAGVRVDQVAARAGFTKPVLYHHFTDKDVVIVEAQAERYRRSLEIASRGVIAAISQVTSREEFDARLEEAIASFAHPESQRQRSIRHEVIGSAVSRPELREAVAHANRMYVSGLATEVDRWRQEGWINPRFSSQELAEWWAVQVHGHYFVEADRGDRESNGWVDVILATVRYLLGLDA